MIINDPLGELTEILRNRESARREHAASCAATIAAGKRESHAAAMVLAADEQLADFIDRFTVYGGA